MSTLSFAVHNDKENATPAGLSRKMNIKTTGPTKTKGINIQPTPRKALIDVNHDPRSSVGMLNNFSKDSFFNPVKTVKKVSAGVENLPQGSNFQKYDTKKTPKIHKKELKLIKETENVVSVQSKAKKRQIVTPQPPAVTNDDEYDSDTILPRSQRLSSYVDKLLTWRPPCLFGTIPDSEPESDQDDVLIDKLVNTPIIFPEVSVPEFSEKDLDNLMMDLPPLDVPEQDIDDQDRIILEATPNTSLSLGTLQMLGNYDLDTSDIQNEN